MTIHKALDAVIDQYLDRYAEPEAQWCNLIRQPAIACNKIYRQVLVIPAYAEAENFLSQVIQHCGSEEVLSIVVVNAPQSEARFQADLNLLQKTQRLLAALQQTDSTPLLLIDRASQGKRIPRAQGVGLARKIGTDIALRLHQQGRVTSPWLYQTDADARLPKTYFQAIGKACLGSGTVVFTHKHVSEDELTTKAAQLYDAHMRYYVEALAAQGSPYAYPTLGSTIAVHAQNYAQVRGYPKRNAGEDFHLLNKLNKLSPVQRLEQPTVEVQARLSSRVTFGTGPSLQKIVEQLALDPSGESYLSYDYRCFELLGHALNYLRNCGKGLRQPHSGAASNSQRQQLEHILQQLGVDKIINPNLYKQPSEIQRRKLLNEWFDALKTLRFIHLASKHYPNQSLLKTLQSLPAT
ncbi:MAG: hypothetical protein GWP50_07775 [Proteobacteria bacterium]|nr:hypothetical protein [Pseudomonadota bacterium]